MDRSGNFHRIAWSPKLAIILTTIAILSSPARSTAGSYTVIPIAGENSFASGINSSGDIVGGEYDKEGHSRAYLYHNGSIDYFPGLVGQNGLLQGRAINDSGTFVGLTNGGRAFQYQNGVQRTLNVPSYAFGVNNSGDVVGYARTASGDSHAFLFNNSNNQITDLGTFGGNYSVALGINDARQVVGTSLDASMIYRAFLYENGVMKDLGDLGGNGGNAQAINNLGQIVGNASTSSGDYHGYLYEGGVMTDLGALGGNYSNAIAINNHGQIVGYSYSASSPELHAFIYNNGVMTDLNSLIDPASGWRISLAVGINDSGAIIAMGSRLDSEEYPLRALLLTPNSVPEPSGLVLLGTGLAGLAFTAARCRSNSPTPGTKMRRAK